MIKEAIDRVLQLATPEYREEEDGRVYTNARLNEVQAPVASPIEVQTLAGLVDLYKLREGKEDSFIHIFAYNRVEVVCKTLDPWRRRDRFVLALLPNDAPKFRFGVYLEPEEFVIGLMTMFEDADYAQGDHRKVVKLCSGLVAEAVTISNDDGFSQQVVTRQGMAMKNEEKVSPRVTLQPWRTFREVSQPMSEFVLRLRGRQGQQPSCALFEADGGEWKNMAIKNIKDYFAKALPDAAIVA